MPTLGEHEGATATATLRPPGAVPPPPRALPVPTPQLDAGPERAASLETPLATGAEPPFIALAGDLAPSPKTPQPRVEPTPRAAPASENTTLPSGRAAALEPPPVSEAALDSTLDMSGSASKKAEHAALIEQTRHSDAGPSAVGPRPTPSAAVPAPGLFIADEPLEPRPKQLSLVTAQRQLLTRMRVVVLVLASLLLMAAGALAVLIARRQDAARAAVPPSAQPVAAPACSLLVPPSRISPIERAVPISAVPQSDGSIALAIADTKQSAVGWLYDPLVGEPQRKLEALAASGDVSHVSATEPLLVDRSSPELALAQTLSPGLALGVGPSGLLRRGNDSATGVVWPVAAGVKVTPPRVASTANGHFVAFRQGGPEGQIITLWLGSDGAALGQASAVEGAPRSLGTPNVALIGERGLVLFSARAEKSEPYRVYASLAEPGQNPGPVRALDLPAEGGGAIAPSLATLPGDRFVAQWTDGNVGHYQVHVRMLDSSLAPLGEPLLVSGKGANAGQGTIVSSARAVVSFFIQTTAGHDELWGATLSCR